MRLLARCYRNSLALTVAHEIRKPGISRYQHGRLWVPLERATRIAMAEVTAF